MAPATAMRPENLVKKSIRGMTAYRAAEPSGFRMDTNANLIGANPVVTRFLGLFDPLELNDYPTPHSDLLRKKLSQHTGLSPDQFIVGNGADELLDLVVKCFIDPSDRLVMPDPTFGMYEVFGKVNCAEIVKVPLKEDWQLDVDGILRSKATVAMLASPNNPTGNCYRDEDIARILREFGGIVVLDEAYGEYARQSYLPMISGHSHVIVLKTFSKAYGLAGLRVGYAVSNRKLTAQMYKAKAPYNVNIISEGIAVMALSERKFLASTVRRITHEREKMKRKLEGLGFKVYPSEANFLMAKPPVKSRTLCKRLLKRGIVIKDLGAHPRLLEHVRITLGGADQNDRLLRAIGRSLGR
jgi:histidinol-phosphate aminotransferase